MGKDKEKKEKKGKEQALSVGDVQVRGSSGDCCYCCCCCRGGWLVCDCRAWLSTAAQTAAISTASGKHAMPRPPARSSLRTTPTSARLLVCTCRLRTCLRVNTGSDRFPDQARQVSTRPGHLQVAAAAQKLRQAQRAHRCDTVNATCWPPRRTAAAVTGNRPRGSTSAAIMEAAGVSQGPWQP